MTEAPEPRAPRLALSLADFELLRRIGDGSYSHVVLARHKASDKEYALKVVDKQYIIRHKVVEHIRRERHILDSLSYPGIVQLFFTFQDAFSLYLGLEHCPNGELYDQIRLKGRLGEEAACFYAGEVVLMLEHLREHAVVHRDLKPENLLLDANGHLKLIDFGSAKRLSASEVTPQAAAAAQAAEQSAAAAADGVAGAAKQGGAPAAGEPAAKAAGAGAVDAAVGQGDAAAGEHGAQPAVSPAAAGLPANGKSSSSSKSSSGGEQPGQQAAAGSSEREDSSSDGGSEDEPVRQLGAESTRAVSLVGTADYVSPEVLNNGCLTCAADLWALGCVIYQMLSGRPPFKSLSEYLTFQKIVEAEYEMPEGLSEAATDLIRRLLQVDPTQRIGATDLEELKAHPFFGGIDWASLRSQPAPEFIAEPSLDPALSSANSSFDWELQSLASALPHVSSAEDTLALE